MEGAAAQYSPVLADKGAPSGVRRRQPQDMQE